MKKLMSGLRRNRNSIGSSSSTDNVSSSSDDVNSKEAITDDENYADLFDDDDDENSKENNLNNNTQRHKNRRSASTTKKRKKLHNSKKVAAVTSTKVMPMMTISEMVECEDDEVSTEDESEGEGVNSDDVTVGDEEDDDIYLLDEDEETTNEESNEDIMEDGEALLGNNDVGEELESKVDSTVTSQVIVVEKEQDAIDVTVDNEGESASSIDEDIRRNNGNEEGDVVSSIDEHIESNNNGRKDVIRLNMKILNSPEAVTPQVSHDNVTQLRYNQDIDIDEEDNHDCLSTKGLYTPSSFMQSLRIKYQVGLEGHA
mmetsp:Transcript_26189/g.44554  ORF Transcript_26189/g.44554 Transcript_26189/m.44554 type:complete len:314 (+) Transcript_26189:179-1120(+)